MVEEFYNQNDGLQYLATSDGHLEVF